MKIFVLDSVNSDAPVSTGIHCIWPSQVKGKGEIICQYLKMERFYTKNLDFLLTSEKSGDLAALKYHSYPESVCCPRLGNMPTICHCASFLNSEPDHFIPSHSWSGLCWLLNLHSLKRWWCTKNSSSLLWWDQCLEGVYLLIKHLLSIYWYFLQGSGREELSSGDELGGRSSRSGERRLKLLRHRAIHRERGGTLLPQSS